MLDAIIGIHTINSILSNLLCMRLINIHTSNAMGRGFDTAWVGCQNTMVRGFDIL